MKKMIIKGVGSFMAKKYAADGSGVEVLTLGTLQDLRIDLNVEIDDIFGGDGLFAIDTLVRSKSIEITATDAKFDLDAISLMMGSKVAKAKDSDAFVWVLGEEKTAATGANGAIVEGEGENQTTTPVAVATITPAYADSIFTSDPAFAVRVKGTNKLLNQATFSANTAPDANTFMYDATSKKIILPATLVGADIVFNYKRADSEVEMAALLKDEIPFPVHVVHHGSFLQKDGTYQGVETELYSCMAMGSFSINAARATASTSQVQLKVVDPERADGRLGTIKRYSSETKV